MSWRIGMASQVRSLARVRVPFRLDTPHLAILYQPPRESLFCGS